MKEYLLEHKDNKRISFYFSVMILLCFFGLISNMNKISIDRVTGTYSGYTMDSVYVNVNWEISYKYDKHSTETPQKTLEKSITQLMEERINMLLMDMLYREYLIVNGNPVVTNENGIKIEIFK